MASFIHGFPRVTHEYGRQTYCQTQVRSLFLSLSLSLKMRQPGIGPGPHRWQRCILPLNY